MSNLSNYDLYNRFNPDTYNFPENTYWSTEVKSTSAQNTGFLWGTNISLAREDSDGKIARQQNDFYNDNVFRNTASGANVLHYAASGSTQPYQYAHMGFKIVHIDSDPGYSHAGEVYRFKSDVQIVTGVATPQYSKKLYGFTPRDSALLKIRRDYSIGPNVGLPRSGFDKTYLLGDAYGWFYNTYTGWNSGVPYYYKTDICGDLEGIRTMYPLEELSWFLDIDENDPNVEFAIQNGSGRTMYDVMLYKNTIGAISADYKKKDTEYTFYTFWDVYNQSTYFMLENPYENALPQDDEEPVAHLYHQNRGEAIDAGAARIMRGGFDPINGIANGAGGVYWTGSQESRRKNQHHPVSYPVIPLVDTRSNLKAVGEYYDTLPQHMKKALPSIDSDINFDIKIYNTIGSEKINKWQIRPGQLVFLRLKNGQTYTNLRVLGVNINKDDDFFTVSVGAKSPTLVNEIERRTR